MQTVDCLICKRNVKLITHHLSYEPEKTVMICYMCHTAIHHLAKVPEQDIAIGWIKEYGSQWDNGHEKHLKTVHYYKNQRKYEKTDKYKINHFKKLSPEKQIEYMENMERQVELIN